ncbi:hypothetical protein C2E23DRAFT_821864 [Lenzites betulinus]|nr:hypothetical protein C2E23DRAFT_821864 [Lenzites betulinus]
MNPYDPARGVQGPGAAGPSGAAGDLGALFAALQAQAQTQQPQFQPSGASLPMGMQLPLLQAMHVQGFSGQGAGLPQQPQAGVQWQGQQGFWPSQVQQVQQVQQQQQQWPGMPQQGQLLQTVSAPTLQMLASAYQLWQQQLPQPLPQQLPQQPPLPMLQQQQYQPPPPPPQVQQPQPQLQEQQKQQPRREHQKQPQRTHSPAKRPRTSSPPVGSRLDDETRIIDALKACKANGTNPREALEQLDGVNDHSASAWKDYFLVHLDRLYAHVRPSSERKPSSSGSARLPNPSQRPRPPDLPRANVQQSPEQQRRPGSSASPNIPNIPRVPPRPKSPAPALAQISVSTSAAADDKGTNTPSRSEKAPTPGSRSRRGERIADFHVMTLIPHTDGRTKPTRPAGRAGTFTDADRIFFIHFLRWRLAQDPLLAKDDLYEELAEEVPYHSADAWKRHWDNNPELPDRIFIEAGQGADKPKQASAPGPKPSLPSRPAMADGHCGHASDGGGGVDHNDNDSDDGDADGADQQGGGSSESDTARLGGRRKKVTHADMRAMARYMYEKMKANEWDPSASATQRWTEFAQRPQNKTRRSLMAWMAIEKKRAAQIQAYLKEYRKQQDYAAKHTSSSGQDTATMRGSSSAMRSDSLSKPPMGTHSKMEQKPSPTMDEKHIDLAFRSQARLKPDPDFPRKRSADQMTAEDELPEPKRQRECIPPEVIELSD